jgi:hypothetical protein
MTSQAILQNKLAKFHSPMYIRIKRDAMLIFMGLLCAFAFALVEGLPLEESISNALFARQASYIEPVAEKSRKIATVAAFVCMFGLAVAMGMYVQNRLPTNKMLTSKGFRAKRYKNKPSFAQILVCTQTVLSICFVISSTVLVVGLRLRTEAQCSASIIVCLFFYTASKITL